MMGKKGVTRCRATFQLHGIAPQQSQEFAVRVDRIWTTGSADGDARVPKQSIASSIGVSSTFVSATIDLEDDRRTAWWAVEEVDPAASHVARNLASSESVKRGLRD
jgi:ribonuclease I